MCGGGGECLRGDVFSLFLQRHNSRDISDCRNGENKPPYTH